MPILSSANRTQLAVKLEGVYPNNFGVVQGGNGKKLSMTSESLKFDIKTEDSKQIRSDGQLLDNVQVGASAQGGFSVEAQYLEYDPFIEGVLKNPFIPFGTDGVTTATAATLTATTSTLLESSIATAGADDWSTLHKGQWFTIIPVAGESAAVKGYLKQRAFRLSSSVAPTTTDLTLDAATPIDIAIITAPLAAGWKITSSRVYNGTELPVIKSYTLEVGHGDINVFRQYTGMIPSKIDYKLTVANIINATIDFMGKSMVAPLPTVTCMGTPDESYTFTPANATKGVFDIFEGGVKLSTTTFVKSLDFAIDAGLRMQDAIGVFGTAGVGMGGYKANGKLEAYFADKIMYDKMIAGASTSLTIPVLDVDGNGYIYVFPRIKYSAANVNVGGGDQDNMLNVDWSALMDTNPVSPTFGFTVAVYRVGAAAV